MKVSRFFANTVASAIVIAMASMAVAEGPVQQQSPQQQQQMPGNPVQLPPPGQQQQSPHQGQQQKPPPKPGQVKPGKPGKPKVLYIRVHRGDSLSKIAYRYRTTVARLKRLNHLKGDKILIGQRLRVH